ncbi:MAG: nitroreductase family protein [Bacteroidales bacterium]|nr:nitroreductase family protein [Bacteroidales bacterium]
MNFEDLIKKNRSYRRFYEDQNIETEVLYELIDYARLSGSSGNIQGLKFFISNYPETNNKIFPAIKWAFYLKDWQGPEEGERPSAYIIILGDTEIHDTIDVDVGIAAQSILLGAVNKGLGGCMIGSVDRKMLRSQLRIPRQFQIPLIIALGKPKETVIIEEVPESENIMYWRDENQIHHVPKRNIHSLIKLKFD